VSPFRETMGDPRVETSVHRGGEHASYRKTILMLRETKLPNIPSGIEGQKALNIGKRGRDTRFKRGFLAGTVRGPSNRKEEGKRGRSGGGSGQKLTKKGHHNLQSSAGTRNYTSKVRINSRKEFFQRKEKIREGGQVGVKIRGRKQRHPTTGGDPKKVDSRDDLEKKLAKSEKNGKGATNRTINEGFAKGPEAARGW